MIRENGFFKSDIARDMELASVEIVNTISTVMGRVAKEEAAASTRGKFIAVRRKGVDIA